MKILVTGGCGFIGSNFIWHMLFNHTDVQIVNYDKLTYAGNLDNVKDVKKHKNYSFVQGDICNTELVDKVVKDCNVIVNFAAETHVDRSILDAGSFVNTDVYGTYVLLEAAKKYKLKYIQISTDEVYGSIDKGSFSEKSKLHPNSPYSASKAGSELLAMSYFTTYGLDVMVTRSSNNFGPFQYPEKLIPLFVTNLLEGKKVPMYGDGKNVRDWLFVLDNCTAIDAVIHKGKPGEIYNIGGGNEISNIEITEMILKNMGKDLSSIEYVKDRAGHDRRYSISCKKITKELGWKPKYKFVLALVSTIAWYETNKEWWQKIKQKEFKEYYTKQYGKSV